MKAAIISILIACTATAALAERDRAYFELGHVSNTTTTEFEGLQVKATPSIGRAVLGYELHKNLALEGTFSKGIQEKKVTLEGVNTQVKFGVENTIGFYIKPKAKISENVEVFGRLGVNRLGWKASYDGYTRTGTKNDISYGAGANLYLTDSVYLTADYTHYSSKDGYKSDGYTIGFGMKF